MLKRILNWIGWVFLRGPRLRALYTRLTVVGRDRVGDREVYAVEGEVEALPSERLLFDVETGLLRRRITYLQTPLGPYPEETDFEDYRSVDQLRLPFLVTKRRSDYSAVRTFDSVRQQVPIDDERFQMTAVAGK